MAAEKIFVGNTSIAWIYLLVPVGLFHVNRKGIKPPPTGLTPVAQKTYFHLNQEKEYRFRNIVTFSLVLAMFHSNKPQINYSDLRTRLAEFFSYKSANTYFLLGVGLILLGLAVFLSLSWGGIIISLSLAICFLRRSKMNEKRSGKGRRSGKDRRKGGVSHRMALKEEAVQTEEKKRNR